LTETETEESYLDKEQVALIVDGDRGAKQTSHLNDIANEAIEMREEMQSETTQAHHTTEVKDNSFELLLVFVLLLIIVMIYIITIIINNNKKTTNKKTDKPMQTGSKEEGANKLGHRDKEMAREHDDYMDKLIQQKAMQRGIPRQQRRGDGKRRWGVQMQCTGHNITEYKRLLQKRRQWLMAEEIRGEVRILQDVLGYRDARRITGRKVRTGGGRLDEGDTEYSLFRQYMAKLEQLPEVAREGYVEYTPVSRADFDKWSRKRQVFELKKLGMGIDSGEEAKTFFVRRDDDEYPTTHTTLELPKLAIKQLTTAKILHHQYHIKKKIQRLYSTN
jgi:hypothetical protein